MRLILGILIAAILVSAAHARDLAYPGIIGTDDRKPIDSTDRPWSAIGKIVIDGLSLRMNCTGVLVGPDTVITAAHCLFNERTGKQFSASRIAFIAGLRRDANLGHSKAKCVTLLGSSPDFRNLSIEASMQDIAVITLANPLDTPSLAIADIDVLTSGTLVTHAGYSRDRPYLLSAHRDCRVLKTWQALAATDCDTNFGQSGGPVLIHKNDNWQVAAIMSAFFEKQASIAVSASAWRSLVPDASCRSKAGEFCHGEATNLDLLRRALALLVLSPPFVFRSLPSCPSPCPPVPMS